MGLFDKTSEPGKTAFRPCPNCGKDQIYSQSKGFLKGREFFCDHCGYEAEKNEVVKPFNEVFSEMREERERENPSIGEAFNEGQKEPMESISDSDLKKQVRDRRAEGWEIEEVDNSGERVVMISTDGGTIGGHALTGVLTGLWTFGLGNVAYDKLSKKKNKERIALSASERGGSESGKSGTVNPAELIRELNELHEEGIITDEEFDEKKQELLDEI